MTIDALTIVLLISIGCNLLAVVYIRDILGRLGWLTQNLANLTQLIRGFQNHIRGVHELEKFYGDEDLKLLVQHANDLIEVMDDYLEVGLDSELIDSTSFFTLFDADNTFLYGLYDFFFCTPGFVLENGE